MAWNSVKYVKRASCRCLARQETFHWKSRLKAQENFGGNIFLKVQDCSSSVTSSNCPNGVLSTSCDGAQS